MIERIGVVFTKELTEHLRDRRSLVNTLLGALIGPAILVILFTAIGQMATSRAERPLELPVAGAEHAPTLISFLEQRNVVIKPAPADPQAEVRAGNLDVALIIPPDYSDNFRVGLPASVQLVNDSTRQAAGGAIARTRDLLEAYSEQTGAFRLQARGVSPDVVTALAIEDVDLATPQSLAANLLNTLPFFIIYAIFVGGMAVLSDSTAGERERGSLEPLLINPLARFEFVLGKMGVALVFTLANVAFTLLVFALVINFLPIGENLGIRLNLAPLSVVGIFLLTLPIVLFATALQMIIATFSRSVKEAQSYLALLPLIPGLPGLVLAFLPLRPELWTMLIPTFGQQLLINQLLRGEGISPANVAISSAITLVIALGLTFVATRLYNREDVVFGR